MSSRNNQPSLHILIAIPVALIVLGALALSAAAVAENLRFIRAADQTFDLVSMVRTIAAGQRGFAQNPGEDIWTDLEHSGQILPTASHLNPWRGELRAVTIANSAMRIESDLPTRDCRRLALYFLARQPVELGLLAIEAQPFGDPAPWAQIYPVDASRRSNGRTEAACGNGVNARLALIFRVR